MEALLAEAFKIAWFYLRETGELGDNNAALLFLSDAIEEMIRAGHRNRMFLANIAIFKYQASQRHSDIIQFRQDA